MQMDTKYIENLTFQQMKMVTQASLAKMRSFDRQFSGIIEVIA